MLVLCGTHFEKPHTMDTELRSHCGLQSPKAPEERTGTKGHCEIQPHTNLGFHPKSIMLVVYAFFQFEKNSKQEKGIIIQNFTHLV